MQESFKAADNVIEVAPCSVCWPGDMDELLLIGLLSLLFEDVLPGRCFVSQ